MSVDFLEPYIRRILSAPETDLKTISAKRVRRQLVDQPEHPAISEEYVKANKDDIDLLIASVYESVNETLGAGANGTETGKRKREDEDDGELNGAEGDEGYAAYASSPPAKASPKSKPRKTKGGLTDEELARQLSEELNGRSARTSRSGGKAPTNGSKAKKGAGRSPKKGKKSAEEVDSDLDDAADEEASTTRRSTRKQTTKRKSGGGGGGGGAKGGFQKEFVLRFACKVAVFYCI